MEIKYLINVTCLNLLAQVLPPGSLSRPRTFSSRPLQTKLMTHNGLFRPIPYLTAVSADGATASQQHPQAQLHRYDSLFRPSSCLFAASPGPELPQTGLSRPSSCILAASPGSAPASWQPLQAQLLPRGSCPRAHLLSTVGLYRPASASQWTLQTQIMSYCGILRPTTCLIMASSGPAPPARHWPLQAQPRSRLWAAFSGPASDFWRPPLGLFMPSLLPPEGPHRPSLCLTADFPRPALASLAASPGQSSSCLSAAPTGPTPASQWPL
ncbi:hypothetical protein H8958_015990 [Nasalis larvatus]